MAVVIGCAGSFAQAADDDDDELLDIKIFRGILKGLGLRKDEPTGIEYRERSPLVLPHQQGIAAAGSRCHRQEGRRLAGRSRHQAGQDAQGGGAQTQGFPGGRGRQTAAAEPVWEMRPPAKGGKAGEAPGKSAEAVGRAQHQCRIGLQGPHRPCSARFWAPKEEYIPFTGEPPRSSLIEPPPGYRTPSPTQPYGVGREKWVAPVIDKNEPVK